MNKKKVKKMVNLGMLPYWEVKAGSRVEIFIDGISRGVFLLIKDSKFYSFPEYEEYEDDELPF